MKKSKFTLEALGDVVFDGFSLEEKWNGWSCPYFNFDQSQEIAAIHKKMGIVAKYLENTDEFQFEINDEIETFQGIHLNNLKVYPIGNSSWIWEESKIQD